MPRICEVTLVIPDFTASRAASMILEKSGPFSPLPSVATNFGFFGSSWRHLDQARPAGFRKRS